MSDEDVSEKFKEVSRDLLGKYEMKLKFNLCVCILDINSLDEVLRSCKSCAPRWYNIGLRLGIEDSVLKRITAGDPVDGLREVLSQWLNQNILPGKPKPSWYTLCIAIHGAGENPAVAESISEEHKIDEQRSKLYFVTQ